MANIKLKELPIQVSEGVNDSDLMLLEDSSDSRAISIRELRLLFSVDDKLQQMQDYFQSLFNQFTINIQQPIDKLNEEVAELKNRATSLEKDNIEIKKQIQWVQDHSILPKGAVFYSYDNTINPNGVLDGEWKCIGYTNSFEDTEDQTSHMQYIYIRIS